MILEGVRIVADWWSDPDGGINAELARITSDAMLDLEAGDAVPDLKNVLDTTRDLNTEDDEAPPDWPVVIVGTDVPAEIERGFSQGGLDGDVTVTGRYVTQGADTAELRMHALYTLRAMYRSLYKLMDDAANAASRTRGGVQLHEILELAWSDLSAPVGEGFIVAGALSFRMKMRDLVP